MSFMQRLTAACRVLRGTEAAAEGDEEVLALRRDLAAARLDLEETREALKKAQARAEALEASHTADVEQSTQSRMEKLFADLAQPLSQLGAQGYLVESGSELAASDVLAVAGQIARALENAGLEQVGAPGEVTDYSPETMQPLRQGQGIAVGDAVRVRFAGYRLGNRTIRKALVERVE